MSYKRINEQHLIDIAEAIRNKNGTDQTYKPREMAAAVNDLKTNNTQLLASIDGSITELHDSSATAVGKYRYEGCSNLTTVDLPEAYQIGQYAFSNCTGLTTVNLPKAGLIWRYAFKGCSGLTTIDLPNVGKIDSDAFQDCDSLTTVILRYSGVCSIVSGPDGGALPYRSDLYIYVPAALKGDYIFKYLQYYNFRSIEDYPEICG